MITEQARAKTTLIFFFLNRAVPTEKEKKNGLKHLLSLFVQLYSTFI